MQKIRVTKQFDFEAAHAALPSADAATHLAARVHEPDRVGPAPVSVIILYRMLMLVRVSVR